MSRQSTGTRRVLWRFFRISLPEFCRDIGSPSVWYSARTLARNSISGGPRNVEVTQRNGNISRITVGWGTLGISRETPCLEHVPDEIIWGFKQPGSSPFPALFLLLGTPFYVSLRGELKRKLKTWAQRSRISLTAVLCTTYAKESQSCCQPFDVTDDRCKEDYKNVKNMKYFIDFLAQIYLVNYTDWH